MHKWNTHALVYSGVVDAWESKDGTLSKMKSNILTSTYLLNSGSPIINAYFDKKELYKITLKCASKFNDNYISYHIKPILK